MSVAAVHDELYPPVGMPGTYAVMLLALEAELRRSRRDLRRVPPEAAGNSPTGTRQQRATQQCEHRHTGDDRHRQRPVDQQAVDGEEHGGPAR